MDLIKIWFTGRFNDTRRNSILKQKNNGITNLKIQIRKQYV